MEFIEKYNTNELREQFFNSKPFHYIVLDNFLESSLAKEIETEIRNIPPEDWFDKETEFGHINQQGDCSTQSKKIALNIRKQIPDKTNYVIDLFSSPKMIQFIEDITGITGLQSDPYLLGGGIHKTTTNGHLSIHCDFNIHPQTQKHRRINALLYLNDNWKPGYNGCLELWNKDMTSCAKKIEPILNRLVIFRITDDALHGSPERWLAPENYPRISLAFYYYTDDRPEHEKNNFHWAIWFKRFGLFY
jgi:Rps23 Pro-64 3,4-dihydroxylase Tpa1-like proline 4-hydroxylase